MRKTAVFLSYVLHPVFMLTWLIAFFTFSDNYFSYFMTLAKKIFLIGAVIIFSIVLPLFNTFLLKKFGYVKSVQMKESSERVMPYISTLVLHLGLLYILHDLAIPFFFKYLIVTSIVVLVVLMIFNFFT